MVHVSSVGRGGGKGERPGPPPRTMPTGFRFLTPVPQIGAARSQTLGPFQAPKSPIPATVRLQASGWCLTQVVIGVHLDCPRLDKPHIEVLVDFEGQTVFGYMRDLGGGGGWSVGDRGGSPAWGRGLGCWWRNGRIEEGPGGSVGGRKWQRFRAVHQIYFLFL